MAQDSTDGNGRIRQVESLLGYDFEAREILDQALRHASSADTRLLSNERLEFLGDAVLGMVVCDYLFEKYPALEEGELTKVKSAVVSRQTCADLAVEMGLDELLQLGKGMFSRGSIPNSLSAGVFEAIIGAMYVDGGLAPARSFLRRTLANRIRSAVESGHQENFKSVLQQFAQRELDQTPQYVVLDEKGPDHAKCFEVCVAIGAKRYASCWGRSKKRAEQRAALEALIALGQVTLDEETGDVTINE